MRERGKKLFSLPKDLEIEKMKRCVTRVVMMIRDLPSCFFKYIFIILANDCTVFCSVSVGKLAILPRQIVHTNAVPSQRRITDY